MLEKKATAIIQCGRAISTEEIKEIQETVDLCQRLSRFELAQTIWVEGRLSGPIQLRLI